MTIQHSAAFLEKVGILRRGVSQKTSVPERDGVRALLGEASVCFTPSRFLGCDVVHQASPGPGSRAPPLRCALISCFQAPFWQLIADGGDIHKWAFLPFLVSRVRPTLAPDPVAFHRREVSSVQWRSCPSGDALTAEDPPHMLSERLSTAECHGCPSLRLRCPSPSPAAA